MENSTAGNETKYWIGLDVGGTKIEALAAHSSGTPAFRVVTGTDTSSVSNTVNSIASAVRQVIAQAQTSIEQVQSVGVGIPGQVEGGIVRMAVNLNLEEYDLGNALQAEFGVPFFLENDVRVGALGAYQYLETTQPVDSLVYLSIGTGIAAGLVSGGKLYRGSHHIAGEIGHIVVDPQGKRCKCGLYGCLETISAGPAIAAEAVRAVQSGEDTRLNEYKPLRTEHIYEAAAANDKTALAIVERSGAYLARTIQSLILTYDPEKVVLGGGVSHAGETFLRPILAELARMRANSSFARNMLAEEKVILLPKDFNAGSWGAWTRAYLSSND